MTCRVKRDIITDKIVEVFDLNNKPSKVYKQLLQEYNPERALKFYMLGFTNEYKEFMSELNNYSTYPVQDVSNYLEPDINSLRTFIKINKLDSPSIPSNVIDSFMANLKKIENKDLITEIRDNLENRFDRPLTSDKGIENLIEVFNELEIPVDGSAISIQNVLNNLIKSPLTTSFHKTVLNYTIDKFKVLKGTKIALSNGISELETVADFNYEKNLITLYYGSILHNYNDDKESLNKEVTSTIIHELFHSLIGAKLYDYLGNETQNLTDKEVYAFLELETIYDTLLAKNPELAEVYAFTNVSELISEVMSNTEVAELLQNIPYTSIKNKPTNMFLALFQALKELFSELFDSPSTAYSAITKEINTLIEEYTLDYLTYYSKREPNANLKAPSEAIKITTDMLYEYNNSLNLGFEEDEAIDIAIENEPDFVEEVEEQVKGMSLTYISEEELLEREVENLKLFKILSKLDAYENPKSQPDYSFLEEELQYETNVTSVDYFENNEEWLDRLNQARSNIAKIGDTLSRYKPSLLHSLTNDLTAIFDKEEILNLVKLIKTNEAENIEIARQIITARINDDQIFQYTADDILIDSPEFQAFHKANPNTTIEENLAYYKQCKL